ncbi:MAG: lysophospholipase [Leptolyngbya sp. SIO1E4]|nr:lysophospholipase [Leptolyngbya sp. SIO1E4]
MPTVRAPQFSFPETQPVRSTAARQRPASGAQLYRQRQLALQAGRLYTRLAPSQFSSQWSQATRQPTYQDWLRLLAREAEAAAAGQGNNRLEIVLGDSFGLWLPPDTLPRDRLWLNQSISGDTTAGILRRLSNFSRARPMTIHLMAGANDLKNGVPEAETVNNLHLMVQRLRRQHPQAQIVVYSVLPTRWAAIGNDRVRSLNTQIAALATQPAVEYRDLHGQFRDQQGNLRADLTTDGLHLNARGYALWQRAILASAG